MIVQEIQNNKTAWLGEFPEHWKVLRIKNLFDEVDQRSETGKEDLLSVSHYTGVTLKRDSLENEDDHITNAKSLVGYKMVQKGDLVSNIMLAWNGSMGISPYDGITSPAYGVYRVKGDNNPEYFGYLFTTDLFKAEIRRNSTGIIESRLRLYTDSFFRIFSLVPPPDEQLKIVQYIKIQEDKIKRFVKRKNDFIELLKEQRQRIIDEALDASNKEWTTKRLKFIADVRFSSVDKHSVEGEETVRLCNYVDVYKHDYITDDLEFMEATASESEIKKFSILKGDVIITKDSEEANDIAVPTFVKDDLNNVVCGYHLALIRANEDEVVSEFLFRKFQSTELKACFEVEATGVTRVGLSMGDIKGVKISFPKSINEQVGIVQYIKNETFNIDIAISKAEKEIELIQEYKKALIAEAVKGKFIQ